MRALYMDAISNDAKPSAPAPPPASRCCDGAPPARARRRIRRPRTGNRGGGRPGAGDQLRPGRGQPAAAAGGGRAPPRAQRHQGQALRRGLARAQRLRGLRRRLHRWPARPPRPAAGRRPLGRLRVGPRQHPAAPPGDVDHRGHRRQRGAHGHRRHDAPVPAPGHGGPPRGARGVQPDLSRGGHHGALPRRALVLVPAVGRRVPARRAPVHVPAPGLPRQDRRAVPHQRVPLLRVQGGPGPGGPQLRAVRAQRRRLRRRHGAALRQHAARAGGRGARGHLQGQLRQGRGDPGVGNRVAVAGRRGRGRRDARERGAVQRQPDAAGGAGEGHPGRARRAAAGVRVRAVQRGPEARAGIGAALRAVQARRHARVRRQRQGADHQRLEGERERERQRQWHRRRHRAGCRARARRRRRHRAGHRILHRVGSGEQGEEAAVALGELAGGCRPSHGVWALVVMTWETCIQQR